MAIPAEVKIEGDEGQCEWCDAPATVKRQVKPNTLLYMRACWNHRGALTRIIAAKLERPRKDGRK